MNFYLDTTEEFSTACCALLKTADRYGPVCADWLAASKGKQGYDRQTRTWLEALPAWTTPADVRKALLAEHAAILDAGRAYYTLLADTALALAEGVYGSALLARLQPHFPGIDLAALAVTVRAAEDAHRKYISRNLHRRIASLGKNADENKDEVEDEPEIPAPPGIVNPDDPPEIRAAALIHQLLGAMRDAPSQCDRMTCWSACEQPGPIARFIEEYCIFDTPDDLPALIARQREAAERGLELKLTLLQETLVGIVSLRLRNALATLSSHFDGDQPGFEIARWMHDDRTNDPANTLRLDGREESGCWRIACDGASAAITEADVEALLTALEQHLHHELSKQYSTLYSTFEKSLAALVELDDREFQAFIRETQSVSFVLMLSGLPEHRPAEPDFDEVHPFYSKVGRNMSRLAWEMMEDDVADLGSAPLDAFELAEIIGAFNTITPNLAPLKKPSKLLLRLLGSAGESEQPTLELPDCPVSQNIALVERFPRQVTLVIGEGEAACRWKVNIDEMRLFACQLRRRAALHDGEAAFVRAWLGEWLANLAGRTIVRRRRFLRPLPLADAALLFSIAPSGARSDWLAACSPAVRSRLPGLMNDKLTNEQCAEATRIVLAHGMFAYRAVY